MNKNFRLFAVLWLVLAGSLGSPQPCFADSAVTLRGDIELQRITVKLSDLFTGVPAVIDRDIAQAPAPGKQVTYDANVLTRVAQKYRLDWQPQSLADHITITSAATHITADMIREAVTKKLKGSDEFTLPKGGEIDVSFDNHALQVDLPADRGADFTLNNFNYDPQGRHFRADLVAETSMGPFSVAVTGRLLVKRPVPVLVKRLEAGSVIGVADLDTMMVPEDRVNNSVITDKNQLLGREIKRDTDEGEVMHVHDVIPPRMVTRGSLVTMKIETPLMIVTAQGKCLQDGTDGEVVRVTNTQSNRIIEATVTGPGVVTVHTAQVLAAK